MKCFKITIDFYICKFKNYIKYNIHMYINEASIANFSNPACLID